VIIADFDAISLAKNLCLLFGFSIDQTLAPAVNELLPRFSRLSLFQLIAVLALDENRTIFWVEFSPDKFCYMYFMLHFYSFFSSKTSLNCSACVIENSNFSALEPISTTFSCFAKK
jgi:hypothetical protein